MHHIFFHNDIDGIMSAAILQCYYPSYIDSCMYPVASTMRGGSIKKFLDKIPEDDNVAILDFEFNDRANFWIDHHYNVKLGPCQVNNEKIGYDPTAKSAAGIILKRCVANISPFQKEVIDMIDMIDSASYPDTNFIFESDHPLMILRAYLETVYPADMTYSRIAEIIAFYKCNVKKAIDKMRINYQSVQDIKTLAQKSAKNMTIFGKCSVINQNYQNQFPRYSEFFLRKDVQYSIRISLHGPTQKYIQIGFNQWCGKSNLINLGEFMRTIPYVKGGGHFNVAAGTILNKHEQKFLDNVDFTFNKDDDMEKYGVDPKDPVESKAQELVKTGVSLQDARKQSQEELEKSNGSGQGELRSGDDI